MIFSVNTPKDIYTLIRERRSIRSYDAQKNIDPNTLQKILDAGLWAASGKNLQNWQLYVLRGEKKKQYLALSQMAWLHVKDVLEKRLKPSLYAFTERFFFTLGDAPVIILALAELSGDDNPQTQIGNVYLAIENIVLAAQYEGLGSCIMGSPLEIEDEVRSFLGIPELAKAPQLKLVCGLTLGYAIHTPPVPTRRPDRIKFFD